MSGEKSPNSIKLERLINKCLLRWHCKLFFEDLDMALIHCKNTYNLSQTLSRWRQQPGILLRAVWYIEAARPRSLVGYIKQRVGGYLCYTIFWSGMTEKKWYPLLYFKIDTVSNHRAAQNRSSNVTRWLVNCRSF